LDIMASTSTSIERTSRWVAVVALVASAFFFGWYGMTTGRVWPAVMPFFGGFVAVWLVAALGIARRRWWGSAFTVGLSVLTLSLMAPGAARLEVAAFLLVQLGLLGALGVRAMAEKELEQDLDEPRTWRHSALAFTSGLAMPWLLATGLLPGGGVAGLIGLGGMLLAGLGILGAFRGKTWGLVGMLAAIPVLVAVPAFSWGCATAPHDVAGEIAAITMGAGLLAWVSPILSRLRG
jgi:hypothetical protein